MKKQTMISSLEVRQETESCLEKIEEMEASVDKLRKGHQRIREGLEQLAGLFAPIPAPPTVIEPCFLVLANENEGETP
jgi:hypothetical protein